MVPKARMVSDFLARAEGPLTADFQREYGLRLKDAVLARDEDEIIDLITWLPNGSAFSAHVQANGDKTKARSLYTWSSTEDLLLGIANRVSHQTYVVAQTQSTKKLSAPEPVPGPRGKTPNGPKGGNATGMARALLAAQKGG